jgi:hypothetical protein
LGGLVEVQDGDHEGQRSAVDHDLSWEGLAEGIGEGIKK